MIVHKSSRFLNAHQVCEVCGTSCNLLCIANTYSPPREDPTSPTSGDAAGGLLSGLHTPASPASQPSSGGASPLPPRPPPVFCLSQEDDHPGRGQEAKSYKLKVCKRPDMVPANLSTTSSLNPARPPEILTPEIFDLICTQMKYIVGLSHKLLIQKTMKSAVDAARAVLPARAVDFGELLWRNAPRETTYEGSVVSVEVPSYGAESAAALERRRGRSPGRGARAVPVESRKHSMSLPKNPAGRSTMVAGGIASSNKNATGGTGNNYTDLGTTSNDSDQDAPSARPPPGASAGAAHSERRARSSSTGPRLSVLAPNVSGSAKNLKRLAMAPPTPSSVSADDSSIDEELPPAAVLNGVALDQYAAKQVAVLQSLPPEVQVRIFQTKGPVYGQWMVAHPLQVRAAAHTEAIRTVEESSIIAAKKQEWELDLLREWDEKRMETFERFLVSRRNRPAEIGAAAETRRPGRRNQKPAVEYYRDKGRQAMNR
jgi:hypothetical protein